MKSFITTLLLLCAAVLLSALNAPAVSAQSSEIDGKLLQTKEQIEKLHTLKDAKDISSAEKEKLEVEIRTKIVQDILDLSLSQLNTAKSRLQKMTIPDTEEWNEVRETIVKEFEKHAAYLEETKKNLKEKSSFSLEALKKLAKDIEEKKTNNIDLSLKKANTLLAIFSVSDILKLTDQRLEKIGLDVSKIYDKKLTKNPSLKNFYDQSSDAVKKARQMIDRGRETALYIYDPDADSATSTKDFLKSLEKELGITAVEKDSKATVQGKGEEKREVSLSDAQKYLETLISGSLKQIQTAYEIFLKMSVNVKQYLK